MSNINEILSRVKKEIDKDFYLSIRIETPQGKQITEYSRKKPIRDQYEYIKYRLLDLPDGTYILSCARDSTLKKDVTRYEVIKDSETPEVIQAKRSIVSKNSSNIDMENISLEDYIDLVKENERLKAENAVLQTQLKMTEEFYKEKTLSDPGAVGASKTVEIIKELAPSALGLLSEFMNQQSRKLDLEEKRLNQTQPAKGRIINRSNLETLDSLKAQLNKALQLDNENETDKILEKIFIKFAKLHF